MHAVKELGSIAGCYFYKNGMRWSIIEGRPWFVMLE